MFCQKCGSEIPDGLLVCQRCGALASSQNHVQMNNQVFNNQPQVVHVPSHMVEAILCLIFCCIPFGIVALVYACRVDSLLRSGDIAGAQHASKMASTWTWIGVGSGLLWGVLYCIFVAAGIVSGF